MNRKGFAVVVVAAGLLVCVSLYASRSEDSGRSPAKRVTQSSDDADLWPASRSWVWNIDPVSVKQGVGVCVRTTESKITAGTSPSFPIAPVLPPKGMERHSGWSLVGEQRLAGRVTCQVIDFREAGLGQTVGKQPLRLLVRLRVGGGLIGITGDESVLAGESFAASSVVEPRWVGDELHLLTIYTRTADTLFAHHVLVQQSDAK
jgi:hypothetical protein